MNEGVTITFALIFVLVAGVGLLLFKEARTHRFWRDLVGRNDLRAIRGIVEGELEHWRTQRPPKGINATVWAGVQALELLQADAQHVVVTTSAEPEFRLVGGQQTQVATALDTAMATVAQILEMLFYDLPNFRPALIRVDVYTAFRDERGVAVPRPILSVSAERAEAGGIDWGEGPPEILAHFTAFYALNEAGEAEPITLPPIEPAADDLGTDDPGADDAGAEDRPASVR